MSVSLTKTKRKNNTKLSISISSNDRMISSLLICKSQAEYILTMMDKLCGIVDILDYDDDIQPLPIKEPSTSIISDDSLKYYSQQILPLILFLALLSHQIINFMSTDNGQLCVNEESAAFISFVALIGVIICINLLIPLILKFCHPNINNSIPDPSNICLPALLSDSNGFQLFMQHMENEHSWENLTFLVELLQIKYKYQLKNNNRLKLPFNRCTKPQMNENYDMTQYAIVECPIDHQNDCIYSYFFKSDGDIDGAIKLPITECINNDIFATQQTISEQMKHLYLKYIKTGASLEIGIDYEEHQRLDNIFDCDDTYYSTIDDAYFTVFDSTAIQIIRSIRRGSFHRFKNSPLFKRFVSMTNLDLSDSNNLRLQLKDPKIYFCLKEQIVSELSNILNEDILNIAPDSPQYKALEFELFPDEPLSIEMPLNLQLEYKQDIDDDADDDDNKQEMEEKERMHEEMAIFSLISNDPNNEISDDVLTATATTRNKEYKSTETQTPIHIAPRLQIECPTEDIIISSPPLSSCSLSPSFLSVSSLSSISPNTNNTNNTTKTRLNVGASPFIPRNNNNSMIITPKSVSSPSYLSRVLPPIIEIDETETKRNRNNNKIKKRKKLKCKINDNKAEYGPMKEFRGDCNVQILNKRFTRKIMPCLINEKLSNLYSFMNKSYALKENIKYFKNNDIAIINYDLHQKNSGFDVYSVIKKQDKTINRNYGWKMIDSLITAKDIENKYDISSNQLPKSLRSSSMFLSQLKEKDKIIEILRNKQERLNIINRTKWCKINIFERKNNGERMTLSIAKKKWISKFIYFVDNEDDINLIPILMFNEKNDHWIEFVWNIKINGCNIGISLKFDDENDNKINIKGIHLDKEYIIFQHQLISPQHMNECKCFDGWISYITSLKIGNPDFWQNKLKDMYRKYEDINKENMDLEKEIDELKAMRSVSITPYSEISASFSYPSI